MNTMQLTQALRRSRWLHAAVCWMPLMGAVITVLVVTTVIVAGLWKILDLAIGGAE